jgi:hypothetical protein
MSRTFTRRYRKASDRRVWVFSDLNHDLAPEQIAQILTAAGLEQARREAEAQATDAGRHAAELRPEGEEADND